MVVVFLDNTKTGYLSLISAGLLGKGLDLYKELAQTDMKHPKFVMIFYTSLVTVLLAPLVMFPQTAYELRSDPTQGSYAYSWVYFFVEGILVTLSSFCCLDWIIKK